jgi:hypothetical protein
MFNFATMLRDRRGNVLFIGPGMINKWMGRGVVDNAVSMGAMKDMGYRLARAEDKRNGIITPDNLKQIVGDEPLPADVAPVIVAPVEVTPVEVKAVVLPWGAESKYPARKRKRIIKTQADAHRP